MAKRFQLKQPVLRESQLHRQLADALRLEIAAPGYVSPHGVVWWSVDMAAYAGTAPGLRTTRGCVAGVPDMCLVWRGGAYFVEIKRPIIGELSEEQRRFALSLLICGAQLAIVDRLEQLLDALDKWGLPRHRRTKLDRPSGPQLQA